MVPKKNLFLGKVFPFILISALLCGGFVFLLQGPFFILKKVDVAVVVLDKESFGSYFPLTDDLQEWIQEIEQWKGKKLWQFPFFHLPKPLSNKPWLEYAKIYRQWPSQLKVKLKPKRVRALYLLSKNSGKFLFADGSLSETLEGKSFFENKKGWRLFWGKSLGLPEAQALRQKALRLGKILDSLESSMLETRGPKPSSILTEVKEVHFSEVYGFTLGLSSPSFSSENPLLQGKSFQKGSKTIHLGRQDFALKLRKISKVLQYLEKKNLQWRVIDASVAYKVLVSMHKTS